MHATRRSVLALSAGLYAAIAAARPMSAQAQGVRAQAPAAAGPAPIDRLPTRLGLAETVREGVKVGGQVVVPNESGSWMEQPEIVAALPNAQQPAFLLVKIPRGALCEAQHVVVDLQGAAPVASAPVDTCTTSVRAQASGAGVTLQIPPSRGLPRGGAWFVEGGRARKL